jgi:hypothetical protein
MGVDCNTIVVFGVSYSFDELQNYINHEDTINLANKIGVDLHELQNIWCEDGYTYVSPYFDADSKDCSYLLGLELTGHIDSIKMHTILEKENDIKKQIRKFSKKYNVPNKENDVYFIFETNVW